MTFAKPRGTLRPLVKALLPFVCAALMCVCPAGPRAAEPVELRVDLGRVEGVIRPLHGINKGPLVAGGIVDVTEGHRALHAPLSRLHDCHWPNPDVVDIHAVFPNFSADPERAESYDFAATDEYLAAVRATGAQIVYRLGESIEHTKTKRFVHPPGDPERWARICVGIIRHCNEGWANGTRLGIRYWEIWNEPENRPACWTGSDEEFLRLYATAARVIKAHDPTLKVGGPSFGYSGSFEGGVFRPSAFVTNFLALCWRDGVPLDFFSWHCYTANPSELATRSRAIRALLDAQGFRNTESHLNEWNYLPGNSWHGLSRTAKPEARQKFYDEMGGAAGGAFLAAALIELQDAPLDVGNLFHAEVGGFGVFTENGVPMRNYHALRAFADLMKTPRRAATSGGVAGKLALAAGLDAEGSRAQVLISNFAHDSGDFRLVLGTVPWRGETECEVRVIDAIRAGESSTRTIHDGTLPLTLRAPAVALVSLRPRGK